MLYQCSVQVEQLGASEASSCISSVVLLTELKLLVYTASPDVNVHDMRCEYWMSLHASSFGWWQASVDWINWTEFEQHLLWFSSSHLSFIMPPPLWLGGIKPWFISDVYLSVCLCLCRVHRAYRYYWRWVEQRWRGRLCSLLPNALVRVRWATDAARRRRGYSMAAPQQVTQLVQTVIPQNVSVQTNHNNKSATTTENSSVIQ